MDWLQFIVLLLTVMGSTYHAYRHLRHNISVQKACLDRLNNSLIRFMKEKK